MNKIIIDQSYVPDGLYDTFDLRVTTSIIKNIICVTKEHGIALMPCNIINKRLSEGF